MEYVVSVLLVGAFAYFIYDRVKASKRKKTTEYTGEGRPVPPRQEPGRMEDE